MADQLVIVELTVEEADMIAKVLLQAHRGNLGHVAYRPAMLSRTRQKIMRCAGLREAEPDPNRGRMNNRPYDRRIDG